MAALLHDIGHAPFSHATEDLMPDCTETGKKYTHEDYTIGIIKHGMRDFIENHPYRLLKETQEIPLPEELEVIDSLESDLVAQGINYVRIPAGKSWYKTGGDAEIYVGYSRSSLKNAVQALSSISSVVKGFVSVRQNRLYVSKEDRPRASDIAQKYSRFWSKGAENADNTLA